MSDRDEIERLKKENERLRRQVEETREAARVCPHCHGLGYYSIFPERWSGTCGTCNGTGKIR